MFNFFNDPRAAMGLGMMTGKNTSKTLLNKVMNPMTLIGTGLLSANQESLTPPNYTGPVMNNLLMGQQFKRQSSKDAMDQEEYGLKKREHEINNPVFNLGMGMMTDNPYWLWNSLYQNRWQ